MKYSTPGTEVNKPLCIVAAEEETERETACEVPVGRWEMPRKKHGPWSLVLPRSAAGMCIQRLPCSHLGVRVLGSGLMLGGIEKKKNVGALQKKSGRCQDVNRNYK